MINKVLKLKSSLEALRGKGSADDELRIKFFLQQIEHWVYQIQNGTHEKENKPVVVDGAERSEDVPSNT